jgi:hypothetical protein
VPLYAMADMTADAFARAQRMALAAAVLVDSAEQMRSIYDRYNIVNKGNIAQALTQAAQYRSRRGYNLATLGEDQARQGTEGER